MDINLASWPRGESATSIFWRQETSDAPAGSAIEQKNLKKYYPDPQIENPKT
tara:strand:- start:10 stop:165 length:156 start_codon:yes stop_codon:yes gene_type:complete